MSRHRNKPAATSKVGDPPERELRTPSGADPDALGQLNPAQGVQAEGQGAAPPLVEVTKDRGRVAAEMGSKTEHGPVADKEGLAEGAYDIYARSGAQQPGGQHVPQEPSTKHNHEVTGVEKVRAMMSHMPADAPKDHVIYGYSSYKLTIGDLLEIAGVDPDERGVDDDGEPTDDLPEGADA